jgi:hypothetical protein
MIRNQLSINISWESKNNYLNCNNIKNLFDTFTNLPMTQFVPFSINDEKTGFPPFGRVDTARYPSSLLGKAYYVYSLPQVSLASRPSQLVKYSS